MNLTPADPLSDSTVKVPSQCVDHHVQEEESRLFAKLRKSGVDLGRLGARLAARKGELMAEMEEGVEA
jgi:hypothetical protein